jgi:hypothetical protein
MPPELALDIRVEDQAAGRYTIALTVYSQSSRTLLIPVPEITGLRFTRADDATDAEWFTRTLQHGPWHGVVLGPSERHEIQFSAVACSMRPPVTDADVMSDRFDRWCVDLRPGEYDLLYHLRVDEDYFDCDSHYRLPDLRHEAASRAAEVWVGETTSDRLQVAFPTQP